MLLTHNELRWTVAMSGASGTIYGRRLISSLLEHIPDIHLDLVVSEAACRVMREEENLSISPNNFQLQHLIGTSSTKVTIHNDKDIGASIASGSYPTQGMVIVPCSMATVAAIACGLGDTLIRRAADVTLKEKRKLIIAPRETPLSDIHLENLLRLSRAGVTIAAAMPGYYHQPASISELVDWFVMRIIDQMGYNIDLSRRWSGKKQPPVDGVLRFA